MTFNDYFYSIFRIYKDCRLKDAMLYALADGKRARPLLLFAVLKDFGLNEEFGYPAALALEMVHSYSLIHDDLPCMDNDDYRRGKFTVHKAYGEDIAVLAGDGLLTHAFDVLASASYEDKIKIALIKELSSLAGMNGMLYGQFLDITNSRSTINDELLSEIEDYKTGALFKCALFMAMYLVNDNINKEFYTTLAKNIGRVFQLQDDLFEVTKSISETGKDASDLRNSKGTALTLYKIDVLETKIKNIFNELNSLIKNAHFKAIHLSAYLNNLQRR